MKAQEVFDSYTENVMGTYTRIPLIFIKGKGSWLWDIHNKAYLDFFPGWGVGSIGHCHPKVMQALRDQVSKLIFVANNYYTLAQAKLARELARHLFPAKMFFCNSGAEANEGAFKLARKYGQGRFEIITFENAFHGRTLAALAATGQKKYLEGFEPVTPGFKSVKFNDIAAVKGALTDKTVGIMLELIQGEGGINVAKKEFVQQLQLLCDQKNLLLIVDEVQSGFGRTGKMFAYEHYGIEPDIITLAKAVGGGLPIGVMAANKTIADCLTPGTHASTFGGGALVCRAALAVIKAIQSEKILQNVQRMSEYVLAQLALLKGSCPAIKEVRGIGLMIGIELDRPGKDIVEKCMAKGLLINCTHDTVLRFMPALTVTKKEVDKAIGILGAVVNEIT